MKDVTAPKKKGNKKEKATNTVVASFRQSLEWTTKNGEEKSFFNEVVFQTDTIQAINSRNVGLWMLGVMKHYLRLQRLQGKTGFKMSKPLELSLRINNKQESMSVKFSLSLSRIETLLQNYPALVCEAFTPAPAIGGITKEKVLTYFENAEQLEIAPAIKKSKDDKLLEAFEEAIQTVDAQHETVEPTVVDALPIAD